MKHVFILQPLGVAIGWGIFDDAISSPKNSTNPRPPQLFNFTVTSFLSYGHPTFQLYSYPKTISTDAHVFSPKFRLPRFCKSTFGIIFFKSLLRGPANTFLGYRMLIQRILPTCFSLIFLFLCFFSLSSPQRFPKKYCQTN